MLILMIVLIDLRVIELGTLKQKKERERDVLRKQAQVILAVRRARVILAVLACVNSEHG